jgi:hypothetical protein
VHTADLASEAHLVIDFGEGKTLRLPVVPTQPREDPGLTVVGERLLDVDSKPRLVTSGPIVRDDDGPRAVGSGDRQGHIAVGEPAESGRATDSGAHEFLGIEVKLSPREGRPSQVRSDGMRGLGIVHGFETQRTRVGSVQRILVLQNVGVLRAEQHRPVTLGRSRTRSHRTGQKRYDNTHPHAYEHRTYA